jgi:hypothetical protein|tara:strand:- start:96 stop:278 length:183 start_codon:yes stop_codon:yes gene_type:complete
MVKVTRQRGIFQSPTLWKHRIGRLDEEKRGFSLWIVTHLNRMVCIISTDAIHLMNREKIA